VIITVSGKPGSGKSTIGKVLASRLQVDHVSAGDHMRHIAAERGLTVLELSEVAERDPEIDREIDQRSTRFGGSRRDLVIDARLAWYFIPAAIKVFLDVSLDVAAARIFDARRRAEVENVDLEATRKNIEERTRSESSRYLAYYGVDYLDLTHYDLVVDTSDLSVEQIVGRILDHVTATQRAERSDS
jgi:predicted cytidylate kinase